MTIPARYTLTEAHFKIAELEADAERLREERDAAHRELRDFQHVEGESLVETAAVAASSFGHAMRRAETAEAEVERLRSDKDERDWRTLEIVTKQAEAAEAKNAKLSALIVEQEAEYRKEKRAAEARCARLRKQLSRAHDDEAIERERAETAEAEVQRLKEGLRVIESLCVHGFEGSPPTPRLRNILRKVRDLLAGSEAEPDEGGET